MTTLAISKIVRDAGTQMRAALDEDKIAEYVEHLDDLPPVKVVYDGTRYILWDGFHTTAAHERAGRAEVRAEVQPGDARKAILLACGANATHGLPRTREDKRRAVTTLLRDPEWAEWSNVAIAKACGVSDEMVRKLRPPTSNVGSGRRGLDGRTINTGNIGKPKAEPAQGGDLSEHVPGDRERAAHRAEHIGAAIQGTAAEAVLPEKHRGQPFKESLFPNAKGSDEGASVQHPPPRVVDGPASPFMEKFKEITRAADDYDCRVTQVLDGLIAECPHERRRHLAQLLRAAAERAEV